MSVCVHVCATCISLSALLWPFPSLLLCVLFMCAGGGSVEGAGVGRGEGGSGSAGGHGDSHQENTGEQEQRAK